MVDIDIDDGGEYNNDDTDTDTGAVVVSNSNGNTGNNDSGSNSNGRGISISALSRVMRQNHDYERLQGIEEGTAGTGSNTTTTGGELEELVFETNQV